MRFDDSYPGHPQPYRGRSLYGGEGHWGVWDIYWEDEPKPCIECGTLTHWRWPFGGAVCSLKCKRRGYERTGEASQ